MKCHSFDLIITNHLWECHTFTRLMVLIEHCTCHGGALTLSSSVSLVACMSWVSSSDILSPVRLSISSSRAFSCNTDNIYFTTSRPLFVRQSLLFWFVLMPTCALCSCRSSTCSSIPPLFSASSSRAPTSNTLSRYAWICTCSFSLSVCFRRWHTDAYK